MIFVRLHLEQCPALGSSVQERHGHTGQSQWEAAKEVWAGAHVAWGGLNEPRCVAWRREGSGWLHCCLKLPGARGYRETRARLFSYVHSNRMRDNGHKQEHGNSDYIQGEMFFTVRVIKHWSRSPRETVASLTLEVFKMQLDTALSKGIQFDLLWAASLTKWSPEVHSNLSYSLNLL